MCVWPVFPQVLVLELETRLQRERERLGELRKKHYELAGVAEGWGEGEEGEGRGQPQYSIYTLKIMWLKCQE